MLPTMRVFHILAASCICHTPVAVAIAVAKRPALCLDEVNHTIWRRDTIFNRHGVVIADRGGHRELLFKDGPRCTVMSQVRVDCARGKTRCSQTDEVMSCWDQGLLHGAFAFYTGGNHIHRTVHIGVGAGVIPTWIERHCPVADVHAADISKGVLDALPFFGVRNTARTHVYLQDGRERVEAQKDNSVDIVFLDAMDSNYRVPRCLRSVEFFRTVYSKLVPGGVLAINTVMKKHQFLEQAEIIGGLNASFPMTHLHTGSKRRLTGHALPCLNRFYVAVKPGGLSSRLDHIADFGLHFQPASQLDSGSTPIHDAEDGCHD